MWEWDPYSTDCWYGVHCTECILHIFSYNFEGEVWRVQYTVLEHAGGTVHDMREGGHYKSPPAEKGQSHEKKNTRNGEKHL